MRKNMHVTEIASSWDGYEDWLKQVDVKLMIFFSCTHAHPAFENFAYHAWYLVKKSPGDVLAAVMYSFSKIKEI